MDLAPLGGCSGPKGGGDKDGGVLLLGMGGLYCMLIPQLQALTLILHQPISGGLGRKPHS